MPVTVGANMLSVVHKGSQGVSNAFPDVCNTPAPPAPPVPIPYPNIAMSSDLSGGSAQVKADGQPIAVEGSTFMQSTGNEAGAMMGVASGKIKGKAEFMTHSFDVKVEGKGVCRALDMMLHNDKNTPPFPVIQSPMPAVAPPVNCYCLICGEKA
jgi:hypothetical protein